VFAVGVAMAVAGFSHATSLPRQAAAYTSSGDFSYTAQTARPDPVVYPNGIAQTGQPLVLGDIDNVSISFNYRFRSQLAHSVGGTIALQVLFVGDSGWRNAYKLVSPAAFNGDNASVTGTLSLPTLGQLLAKLQAGSRRAARAYTVFLQPIVHYQGTVGGHKVDATYSPTLAFTLDAAVFAPEALNLQDSASQQNALARALHPTQTGSLERSVTNVISFAGLHAPALVFRVLGCLLALIGLVVAVRSQRRHRDDVWSHEKRVAFRAGRSLVEVRGLEEALPPGSVVTEVKTFEDLVALAAQCGRPVLREERPDGELFGVDSPPRLYLYRKSKIPAAAPAAEPPSPAALRARLRA
jgi:hypothetical protein